MPRNPPYSSRVLPSDQVFDERVPCERVVIQSTLIRVWVLPLASLRFYAGQPSRFHYFGLKRAAAAMGASDIAKALKIGRASVYRVLEG